MKQHKPKAAQQAQAQAQQIKQLEVAEIVARALFLYRKRVKAGKTSRRISFPLPPHLLPPEDGVYSASIGEVSIKAAFNSIQRRWWVTVKLPASDGFSLKDHIKQLPQQPPSKLNLTELDSEPSPSQSDEDYLDLTLTEEELKEVESFIAKLKAQLE